MLKDTKDLRIIAGDYKGFPITPVRSKTTHPMSSRARNAIMNSLGDSLPGAYCVDAYAGTGSLGFEAISRGAYGCLFIENSLNAAQAILATCNHLLERYGEDFLDHNVKIYPRSVKEFIERSDLDRDGIVSIMFVDPPYELYNNNSIWKTFGSLFRFAREGGHIVVSYPESASEEFDAFVEKERFIRIASHSYSGANIAVLQLA